MALFSSDMCVYINSWHNGLWDYARCYYENKHFIIKLAALCQRRKGTLLVYHGDEHPKNNYLLIEEVR